MYDQLLKEGFVPDISHYQWIDINIMQFENRLEAYKSDSESLNNSMHTRALLERQMGAIEAELKELKKNKQDHIRIAKSEVNEIQMYKDRVIKLTEKLNNETDPKEQKRLKDKIKENKTNYFLLETRYRYFVLRITGNNKELDNPANPGIQIDPLISSEIEAYDGILKKVERSKDSQIRSTRFRVEEEIAKLKKKQQEDLEYVERGNRELKEQGRLTKEDLSVITNSNKQIGK